MKNEFMAENEIEMDSIEIHVDIQDGLTLADLGRIAVFNNA